MRKILGLDIGSGSIGWAFVKEADQQDKAGSSEIVKMGVRVIHYGDNLVKKDKAGNISSSNEPVKDFEKGMALSLNAGRTKMRGMRRNLQRYKQRRENLIRVLKEHEIIDEDTPLFEKEKNSTFETCRLRAKAAKEPVELHELARVLLMINKKRGYKSSRKAKNEEETGAVDSMSIARELYDRNMTPGQYVFEWISKGKKDIPDFYRSDLYAELDQVWQFQKQFYPELLTSKLYEKLKGFTAKQTVKYFLDTLDIDAADLPGNAREKKETRYALRAEALKEQKPPEELVHVFADVNGDIANSSGYLGAISDRSKKLYFNKETVGEYLYKQLRENPHTRLKKQVFYRQDYLDEFEKIWEVQAGFHPVLTESLKRELRDTIIFYQRRLKSQKHLITDCELEKHHKAVPRSSPLFQAFRLWHNLLNVRLKKEGESDQNLDEDQLKHLQNRLCFKGSVSGAELIRELGWKRDWKCNFTKIEGNRTNHEMLKAFSRIAELEGYELDTDKDSDERLQDIRQVFESHAFDTRILDFNVPFEQKDFDTHPYYQLWHLLYSAEDDTKLIAALKAKYGFSDTAARVMANLSFEPDYGRYSSRAIRKLLPYMKEGNDLTDAISLAGYKKKKTELVEELELLKMGELRNPVVEKILNQVVNQVNAILKHPEMGRPDEIRIELARELKKNAEQRREMTKGIADATANNERVRKLLKTEFGFKRVSRNALIRYKLWEECGHVSIYTGKPIPRSELYGNKYDIEHIIPRSKLFDDSFSNKILCERAWNEEKGKQTATEYLEGKLSPSEFEAYLKRIEDLKNKKGGISHTKYRKLTWRRADIPDDFIERQLRESQYIARKARELLLQVTENVNTTIGPVTDRLREDWGLVNVMKELNWDKYAALGLTEEVEDRHGRRIRKIKDWNKRNDHRHHAMDALAVAFTKRSYVQYLNNLNARDGGDELGKEISGIERKELYRDHRNKLRFNPPMPAFREEAKKHLEKVLVSFKARNKVATRNTNRSKLAKGGVHTQVLLTPRGQMHKETVYGKIQRYQSRFIPVNATLTYEIALTVAHKKQREAILQRLDENQYDPKKAFAGKNSIKKKPILLNGGLEELPVKVKVSTLEDQLTIRKEVNPDNFKNAKSIAKVIDAGARRALEKRLAENGGDAKAAFSNLGGKPIWLNEEKGIQLKSVKITGVKNAVSLHKKRGADGKVIRDEEGKEIPSSYVSPGNNHHTAIYQDEEGNLYDEVVSFYEAVQRLNQDGQVIRNRNENGHRLKFTLKQNEYFVFPSEDFHPDELDLTDPDNYDKVSPHLFRVQKFSRLEYGNTVSREYVFRHHLETQINDVKELRNKAYKILKSLEELKSAVKVRVNRLGEIVQSGAF